jgi:hypothetical protein
VLSEPNILLPVTDLPLTYFIVRRPVWPYLRKKVVDRKNATQDGTSFDSLMAGCLNKLMKVRLV